ncbi:probable fatty acyl-CoA reductase 5 [Prosopis cineraria]|uniref:probable fatty acyl-CoA reductase 5 n=1 Tax=Prosopis cineraria TaxID=364024 RepID=UPI00240EDD6D|nr:probable fatty acyl-CoA reductase 5 [Prosopis cineraria]
MESRTAQQFFKGKTILVTGATGFLAKVFVEKLLRIQPDLKKLYLLLRASSNQAATRRLHDEILSKELFKVVREKWGADFDTLISEKIVAVAGDVSLVNLGLKDADLHDQRQVFKQNIDVIVNLAATTDFDQRFDIAMGVNVMGALHVLNFAKTCLNLKVLLHVSTAYVCGEAKEEGGEIIKEEPLEMGQSLNKRATKLDVDEEKTLMEKKLQELQAKNGDENAIDFAMKHYGTERAKFYGWPNTYVFTKAMGEMFLSHLKGNIPLIIVRPTMVTSTFKEPFPGWIEGLRTVDSVINGYGKGIVTSFLGHPNTILDVIPVDMVVNCMVAAMVTHSNQVQETNFIHHIGSSFRNPLKISHISDILYLYFTKNPFTTRNGKQVSVSCRLTWFTSMTSFQTHVMIRYVFPLELR